MKILHVTQYFHPQRGYQENQLAKLQAKDGHEVYIVASNNLSLWGIKSSEIPSLDKDYKEKNKVNIIRLNVKRKIGSRLWLKNLKSTLNSINPDLLTLHIIPTPATFTGLKWGAKNNKKIIADSHMVWAGSARPKLSKIFYTFFKHYFSLFRKLNKVMVDKWVAVSSETIDFMKQNYGIKDNILLSPLGYDSDSVFYDEKGAKKWMEDYRVPIEKRKLLYIGKINLEKDPIQLVEVFNALKNKYKDLILVFVGDYNEDYKTKLVNEIEKFSLKKEIYLLPSVKNSEIKNVFSAVSVAIWPHASSMAMIEAMACNCPVVASNMPVNHERLADDRGMLFQENDLKSLENAITKVLENSNVYSQNAKEWVEKLSWSYSYKDFYV